ncbi:hypothetical protein BDZ90DRAFT_234141 [Jaminaea rosea]|uniref:Alpha/beta-hydrolase n=1 Tax=Jaminaea rosea TaxID=1569628 RepID=A0A316UJ56_9BASI|nr:hypothetical protein BDZ90DRAFT_234141 [Jaminaea rosea]PWN25296.1 hypothetical protein BDZ90DRAFT_234141 [Jaminaea rosea]
MSSSASFRWLFVALVAFVYCVASANAEKAGFIQVRSPHPHPHAQPGLISSLVETVTGKRPAPARPLGELQKSTVPSSAPPPVASSIKKTQTKASSAVKNPSKRPVGAFATTYPLSAGDLFVWQSKNPHNEADTESATIIIHGVDRNAGDYFTTLNTTWKAARNQNLARAPAKSMLIAPLFFDQVYDKGLYDPTTLAWGENNAWCLGEGSTNPSGSGLSSLSALDELVARFSNRKNFPNMKYITFVGHGCGGMTLQRYAALTSSSSNGVPIRYVVGNPSSMLYWSRDRPSDSFNANSCPYYNSFFFGLDDFYIPYPKNKNSAQLFKSYVQRDVRYLVSLDDNGGGDQTCEAKAAGGVARKSRTLAYWKYINILSGKKASDYSQFPGSFTRLQKSQQGGNSDNEFVDDVKAKDFTGVNFAHQLVQLSGVGHNAPAVLTSSQGRKAIFA